MTIDELIKTLTEIKDVTPGNTPVFIGYDLRIDGEVIEDFEKAIIDVDCFGKIKGGDEVIIRGSNE